MNDYRSWDDAIPDWGSCLFLGHKGEGKSVLAWWLADGRHKKNPDRAVIAWGIPHLAQGAFPAWVQHLGGDINQLRQHRDAIVIVDEAGIRAPARRSMSDENLAWLSLVAIARQAHQLLLYISQHTRQVDVSIVGDADRIVFKLPSELHVRFARAELRPEVMHAREFLLGKADPKRWAYVKDFVSGKEGGLRNGLPDWWTDDSSEAYSLAQAGEVMAPRVGVAAPSGASRRNGRAHDALTRR